MCKMGLEIEYKYLVKDNSYKTLAFKSYSITQGYLSRERGRTVRVRVRDDKAYITIKSARVGLTRHEYEYEIPLADGQELIKMCPAPVLYKTRYLVEYKGNIWEVDEFHGDMAGLVTAEIEIPNEEYEFEIPPFVGDDVTEDRRYHNSNLGL